MYDTKPLKKGNLFWPDLTIHRDQDIFKEKCVGFFLMMTQNFLTEFFHEQVIQNKGLIKA